MNYSTSMVKVNGKWLQMLIISNTQPLTFENNIITHQEERETITYHTDGLYKEVEENGVHYYWFPLNSIVTRSAEMDSNRNKIESIEALIGNLKSSPTLSDFKKFLENLKNIIAKEV